MLNICLEVCQGQGILEVNIHISIQFSYPQEHLYCITYKLGAKVVIKQLTFHIILSRMNASFSEIYLKDIFNRDGQKSLLFSKGLEFIQFNGSNCFSAKAKTNPLSPLQESWTMNHLGSSQNQSLYSIPKFRERYFIELRAP